MQTAWYSPKADTKDTELRKADRRASKKVKKIQTAVVTRWFERYAQGMKEQLRRRDQRGFSRHVQSMEVEVTRKVQSQCILDDDGRLLREKDITIQIWVMESSKLRGLTSPLRTRHMEMTRGENAFMKRQIQRTTIAGVLLLVLTAIALCSFIEKTMDAGIWASRVSDRGSYVLEERSVEYEREGVELSRTAIDSTNLYSDARGERLLRRLSALKVVDVKRHLNELVEASVAASDQQLCNIALLKTHKTGSTTLASLFYRYGVRHGLKVARYDNGHPKIGKPLPVDKAFPKILKKAGGRVDIMHYHIGTSNDLTCTWEVAEEHYRQIMRDPSSINFVTVLREPREHLLSYYYYFVSHKFGHKSIVEFFDNADVQRKRMYSLNNTVARELGVKNEEDLHHFSTAILPEMKLVMLSDRFDEGLMLLRILMGWHLIDMTYMSLNTNPNGMKTGVLRSPKKQAKGATGGGKRPHFDELPKEVQDKIDELTQLDKAVYEAGKIQFEKTLAPYVRSVEEGIVEFHKLQAEVEKYLEENPSSLANDLYRYEDFFHVFPEAAPF